MFAPEIPLFEDLNREAMKISAQNAEYDRLAGIGHPDSVRNAQNRVAVEQAGHIAMLGELVDEMPYEEVGQRDVELSRELTATLQLLDCVETTMCFRKLGVLAFSGRILEECYPDSETQAAIHVAKRMEEINADRRAEIEAEIAELEARQQELDSVFDAVAGEAWPVPLAHYQEVPQTHVPKHEAPRPEVDLADGTLIDYVEDPIIIAETELSESERLEEFRSRHIDEPNASPLIAFYLIDQGGDSVGADELVEFLYPHLEEGYREPCELRSRVTTMLGPKVQGVRMKRLLAEEGYALQYGWREYVRGENGSSKRVSKRRAYKAVPMNGSYGELQEFTEVIRLVPAEV